MIAAKVTTNIDAKRVGKAIDRGAYRSFAHAAASIRKDAISSIQPAPKEQRKRARRRSGKVVRRATHTASRPGTPPHTNRGQIKRAILFKADKSGAVIGPRYSVMQRSAAAHEHGGAYKGGQYPKRPFMLPAMTRQLPRFAKAWAGALG